FNTTGTQTEVGSSDNTYEIRWDDPTATAKATNYTVDDTVGTLRVDAKSIEDPNDPYKPNTKAGIDVDSPVDFKYDGQAHKYVPVVKDGDKTLVEGTDYTVTYKKWDDSAETTEFTHKSGTIRVYITGIGNYSGTVRRSYCINPRLLKIYSEDETREYNGQPLENHTITIGGDGFVEGEGATYYDWASITDVGSTWNTFMSECNPNTKYTDYTWEYYKGNLKVKPAKITIKKEEYQTYTGDEIVMNITEADVTSGTLYARDNIKISAKVKGTTVGDYEEVVEKTITGTTRNYDITVVGKLHITAAKTLNFTATGCDETYDGDPHTGTASSTVSGTTFKYSTDGGETWVDEFPSITDAGELNVKVKASNPNYEDATKDVVLKISKKAVTAHRELTQEYTGSDITMNITAADITGLVDGDDVTLSAAITGKEAKVYQTLDADP
ncbi:MAG: hypothetical protein HUJ57_03595, partial [Erysipelotrichaceae bacterium]|nr:hypothetical protein [Erysipelotrichaceae bacterium]